MLLTSFAKLTSQPFDACRSVFVRALNQCMIDHCNVADRLTGLQFADSICALAQNAGISEHLISDRLDDATVH